jgi:ABC-type multidrug transport system fused ATPase/permease subunit
VEWVNQPLPLCYYDFMTLIEILIDGKSIYEFDLENLGNMSIVPDVILFGGTIKKILLMET